MLQRLLHQGLYWLVITLLSLPLLVGVLGTILPSFGMDPGLGRLEWNLISWRQVFTVSEFWASLKLSLWTGFSATLLAYWFASSIVVSCQHKRWFQLVQNALTPILSIPHAAMTIGLVFLLAPSGWLLRLASPWLTGFDRPPNWITTQDPLGLTLILALAIKEMPYLLFVMMAALPQIRPNDYLNTAATLGYRRTTAWHFILLPRLYPLIKLPIFVVLAFNMTVVDVATLIGPNTPSTLAVTILRWFNDPALNQRGMAASAALLLAVAVMLSILVWHSAQASFEVIRHRLALNGRRQSSLRWLTLIGHIGAWAVALLTLMAFCSIMIWTVTRRWRFPNAWPSEWTWSNLHFSSDYLTALTGQSFSIAIVATLLALIMSLILLERQRTTQTYAPLLLYATILVPQITLLFGIQVALITLGQSGDWSSVVLLHTLYVTPYFYLTLKGPYLAFDQRYLEQANRLRPAPFLNYVTIKLGLLKSPVAASCAIGFSVSMAQYLPTLMAGEGRIMTLTTEAVARASSGERKTVSVLAFAQSILPLLMFWLALVVPKHWLSWRLFLRRCFARTR